MQNGDEPPIDIWCAIPKRIDDERLLADYRRLLTDEEREQETRMHFARDQRRHLVTRALVRIVLSRYAGVAPEAWRFVPGHHGKPEIANDAPDARDLSFNITHGGELVIVAVARGIAVGIDTESVRARPAPLDIADRYFTRNEAACLNATPAPLRQQRFFEIWTLKEAYIKARAMGLSLPLEQFEFRFESEDRVGLWLAPALRDRAERWHLWQLWPDEDHVAAICAERVGVGRPTLRATAIVPWVSERDLDYRLARTSFPR